MCRLCVRVLINKLSFEPFTCLAAARDSRQGLDSIAKFLPSCCSIRASQDSFVQGVRHHTMAAIAAARYICPRRLEPLGVDLRHQSGYSLVQSADTKLSNIGGHDVVGFFSKVGVGGGVGQGVGGGVLGGGGRGLLRSIMIYSECGVTASDDVACLVLFL